MRRQVGAGGDSAVEGDHRSSAGMRLGRKWSSSHILLEGTPEGLDMDTVRRRIIEIPGVQEVHDLHFWTLTSGLHSASVHVRKDPSIPSSQLIEAVQDILRRHASVEHATVQVDEGIPCESDHA